MCFLHHGSIPHIIHRDLKSGNVLLDDALEARVSDFGIACLVSASETHLESKASKVKIVESLGLGRQPKRSILNKGIGRCIEMSRLIREIYIMIHFL